MIYLNVGPNPGPKCLQTTLVGKEHAGEVFTLFVICRLFSKKIRNTISVKQFGHRSGQTFCLPGKLLKEWKNMLTLKASRKNASENSAAKNCLTLLTN